MKPRFPVAFALAILFGMILSLLAGCDSSSNNPASAEADSTTPAADSGWAPPDSAQPVEDAGDQACNPNPCQNGGVCVGADSKARCDCTTDYVGERCQFALADCVTLESTYDISTSLPAGCYLAQKDIAVKGGALLTLEPGVWILFAQGRHFNVEADGKLSAVGTADKPIVLTAGEPLRGAWAGLRFDSSNSTQNKLAYVTIEYGGGDSPNDYQGNLNLSGASTSPARVAITNCTFRHSKGYGFYFARFIQLERFSENTATQNALGAGSVVANSVGELDDKSSYSGNDKDLVEVWDQYLKADQRWPAIDADYWIKEDLTVEDAQLTLAPGARLVFAPGGHFTIRPTGRLTAVGQSGKRIVLTGGDPTPGTWAGLKLDSSNSTDNKLQYVTIEYGGGDTPNYFQGNLNLEGSSSEATQIAVTNCLLQHGKIYGLYFVNKYVQINSDYQTANTYTSNPEAHNALP